MAAPIALSGLGSGLDVEGIIQGLVQASSASLSSLKSRAAAEHAAVSTFSDLGSMLGTLKSALDALSDASGVKSFTASSSDASVVASADGTAQPGSWNVDVLSLAKEQRTYTNTFDSSGGALGQSGTLSIKIGSADAKSIDIVAGDSLDSIVNKINGAGLRVSASVLFDGTTYRMQVRGMDTGAANALTFTESGTTLGLTTAANTVQAAADSKLKVDGFTITRPTNQVTGAIPGLTLALTNVTTSATRISVDSDPDSLKTKLNSVVSAYNAVIQKVHAVAGFGTVTASNPVLAADSTLRTLTNRLSDGMLSIVTGSAKFQTLGSIGLNLANDGTLTLDESKLNDAVSADFAGVANVLAGATGKDGAMDVLSKIVDSFTKSSTGLLATKSQALTDRANDYDDEVTRQQDHLDWYEQNLRTQFAAMDQAVSSSNSLTAYLNKL